MILKPGRAATHFGFPGKVKIGATLDGVLAGSLKLTQNQPETRQQIGRILHQRFNIKKRMNLIILGPKRAATHFSWPGYVKIYTMFDSFCRTTVRLTTQTSLAPDLAESGKNQAARGHLDSVPACRGPRSSRLTAAFLPW